MIRATVAADTPALLKIAQEAGLFLPADLKALQDVLAAYHEVNVAAGHRCFTEERKGEVIGFVYEAPAAMTDRTWYLWWLVVAKKKQAHGVGGKLLKYAEESIRAEHGRLMMITSPSLPSYEPARHFYLKHGYELAAVVKDFYADGNDLVLFRKRLLPDAASSAQEKIKRRDG